MGQQNEASGDDELLEWIRLGERIRRASPSGLRRAIRVFRDMVEGLETIAAHDGQLVLRRRPTKTYRA